MALNCPDCQSSVAEDDRFCGECGTPLAHDGALPQDAAQASVSHPARPSRDSRSMRKSRNRARRTWGPDDNTVGHVFGAMRAMLIMPFLVPIPNPELLVRRSARESLPSLTEVSREYRRFVEAHVARVLAHHFLCEHAEALEALDAAFAAGLTQARCPPIRIVHYPKDGRDVVFDLGRSWAAITRAELLVRLGRPEEALAVVEQALRGGIDEVRTADLLGLQAIALIMLGRIDEARASWGEAAERSEPSRYEAEARAALARVDGRYEDWRDALTEALAIDPGDVDLLTMRIDSHLANEDIESARADREEAARILEQTGASRERVMEMRNYVL